MKSLIAVASSVLQLIYVLALLQAITSIIKYFQVQSLYGAGDPKLMAGAISTATIDFLLGALIGLIGVFLAWWVLRDKKQRPSWFLPISTFLAWTWMVFIPIGTIVGVMMLRWRKPESAIETVS